jgi:hypothetical protein
LNRQQGSASPSARLPGMTDAPCTSMVAAGCPFPHRVPLYSPAVGRVAGTDTTRSCGTSEIQLPPVAASVIESRDRHGSLLFPTSSLRPSLIGTIPASTAGNFRTLLRSPATSTACMSAAFIAILPGAPVLQPLSGVHSSLVLMRDYESAACCPSDTSILGSIAIAQFSNRSVASCAATTIRSGKTDIGLAPVGISARAGEPLTAENSSKHFARKGQSTATSWPYGSLFAGELAAAGSTKLFGMLT